MSWFCFVNWLSSVKKKLWQVCICVRFKFVTRLPFEWICGYKTRYLSLVEKHRIYTLSFELVTTKTNISACLIRNYVLLMSKARTALLFADWIVTYTNNEGANMSVSFIKKIQQDATMYQNFYYSVFIWSSTCLGRHTPIIRSLKLHWPPLVFHTWKVVGRVVGGRCQAHTVPDNVHQLHVQQLSTYEKPESASAVLGSRWWAVCRPRHV